MIHFKDTPLWDFMCIHPNGHRRNQRLFPHIYAPASQRATDESDETNVYNNIYSRAPLVPAQTNPTKATFVYACLLHSIKPARPGGHEGKEDLCRGKNMLLRNLIFPTPIP